MSLPPLNLFRRPRRRFRPLPLPRTGAAKLVGSGSAASLPKQSSRRIEADLSFMLGGQALNRWSFRLAQMQQIAGNAPPAERELLIMEASLAMRQIASLATRMDSFSRSRVLSIRFQAQEMLIAATRLEAQLADVQRQLALQPVARPAEEVATALLSRARRRQHRRAGSKADGRENVGPAVVS